MKDVLRLMLPALLMAAMVPALMAQEEKAAEAVVSPAAETQPAESQPAATPAETPHVSDEDNLCIQCHLNQKETERFYITPDHFAKDIHWQMGMRCQDCHGGDPTVGEIKAHQAREDFRAVKSPADIPAFCGNCHADIQYMRRYRPSPRTDQLAEYWTSGHGKQLKATGDPKVATCVSCHGKPHGTGQDQGKHGILAVADPQSPVYHTRVAETCSKCHSDKKLMAGRQYNKGLPGAEPRPFPCNEFEKWSKSVHGVALLKKGDLSAPACNNCHGNHGAVPPQVSSVANACGSCHGKIAKLFGDSPMKHKFEAEGLPGCVSCHSNHDIQQPSDEMLGMEEGAVCIKCHAQGKFGATAAGAAKAKVLRADVEQLKQGIDHAKATLTEAERLGMEVSQPRFELRKANDSLTNARSLIHTFAVLPAEPGVSPADKLTALEKSLKEAKAKGAEAKAKADEAKIKGDKAEEKVYRDKENAYKAEETALAAAKPLTAAFADGDKVVAEVQKKADHALEEHTTRRIWLAASLVPIFLAIGVLLLYIRSLPPSENKS